MSRSIKFDPNGTFVASKSGGLILASKEYQLGDTIDKTGISRRKLQQLWSHGRIAYGWMLEGAKKASKAKEAPPKDETTDIDEPSSKTPDSDSDNKSDDKPKKEVKVKIKTKRKTKSKSKTASKTKKKRGNKS